MTVRGVRQAIAPKTVLANLTSGNAQPSPVSIADLAPHLQGAMRFQGTVTSIQVSGGTTGLTFSGGPITTAGTITMAGTLAIANGGTGNTTGTATINANMTGPVTSVGNATSVTNNAITNAMLAQMATLTLKGNNTGGTANAIDLTVAQAVAMLGALTHQKVGSFTYDVSTTGTQAVTGVGFQPKSLVLLSMIAGGTGYAVGFDDATTHILQTILSAGATQSFSVSATASMFGINDLTAAKFSLAAVTSMDADGFTITKSKTGLPTGTCTVYYLAIG